MTQSREPDPLHVFRFRVEFTQTTRASEGGSPLAIGGGGFAECTGLEATMEPKVYKEGGRNFGAVQLAGPVTFGTVVLKRGITTGLDLWSVFNAVGGGAYSVRLGVTITLLDGRGKPVTTFELANALPVKLKTADLNARATEVGIEELHLAHEGLSRR